MPVHHLNARRKPLLLSLLAQHRPAVDPTLPQLTSTLGDSPLYRQAPVASMGVSLTEPPMPDPIPPIRPTTADARSLAHGLLRAATTAALAFTDTDSGTPAISRIGFGLDPQDLPLTLLSDLSAHTQALRANPDCALLLGDPGFKGDPMASPRLSLTARASFIAADDAALPDLRQGWLVTHPKAQLYIGFADFHFARFTVSAAFLNGGFGRAFRLTAEDLFN